MKFSAMGGATVAAMLCLAMPSWADWRLPVGFSYVSGIQQIQDLYKENLNAEGYVIAESIKSLPVGLSFSPYWQFESGLAVGGMIGPAMIIGGDASFQNLPIGLDLRYLPFPAAATSPYLRTGVKHNLAGGDYVEKSIPGFIAGAGIEFRRNSRIGFGFEALYDSSKIRFEEVASNSVREIQPARITVTASLIIRLSPVLPTPKRR